MRGPYSKGPRNQRETRGGRRERGACHPVTGFSLVERPSQKPLRVLPSELVTPFLQLEGPMPEAIVEPTAFELLSGKAAAIMPMTEFSTAERPMVKPFVATGFLELLKFVKIRLNHGGITCLRDGWGGVVNCRICLCGGGKGHRGTQGGGHKHGGCSM